VEAEQGVLGSMLISPSDAIAECVEKINEQYFYVPAHQTIYRILVDPWDAGAAIDLITFTQVLRDQNLLESVGGAPYVTHLFKFVPCPDNVSYCIDIVREQYSLRQIIAVGTEAVRLAQEKQADGAEILSSIAWKFDRLHSRNESGSISHGATKTMEFCELGLEVTLSKGRAYMIRIHGLPRNNAGVFWHFIRR
jgi:replicative DNA helicase